MLGLQQLPDRTETSSLVQTYMQSTPFSTQVSIVKSLLTSSTMCNQGRLSVLEGLTALPSFTNFMFTSASEAELTPAPPGAVSPDSFFFSNSIRCLRTLRLIDTQDAESTQSGLELPLYFRSFLCFPALVKVTSPLIGASTLG